LLEIARHSEEQYSISFQPVSGLNSLPARLPRYPPHLRIDSLPYRENKVCCLPERNLAYNKFWISSSLDHNADHMNIVRSVALRIAFLARGAFALMVGCQFAYGQSLDEINKRDAAVREAFLTSEFTTPRQQTKSP